MATPKARNGSVDALRFFGAGGILWFHAQAPGAWIAIAAFPMFMALTVYFGLHSSSGNQQPGFGIRRAARLLVPWVG